IFEAHAFPWHECHEQVLPEREITVVGRRDVSQYRTEVDAVTFGNADNSVVGVALVRASEHHDGVMAGGGCICPHGHKVSSDLSDNAWLLSDDRVTGVNVNGFLHACTNQR